MQELITIYILCAKILLQLMLLLRKHILIKVQNL